MPNKSMTLFLPDETATLTIANQFAQSIGKKPAILFLHGQLGAGKTTFSRGFLQGLGYHGKVKSPTYTLVEPYELEDLPVYHFDFYRLFAPEELEFIGIREYFAARAICLIEWPEKAGSLLPEPDISCYIELHATGREFKCVANSARGEEILSGVKN
jgi:tRNA threonylcarbamoyladenosine biosynthesis protein TsaE